LQNRNITLPVIINLNLNKMKKIAFSLAVILLLFAPSCTEAEGPSATVKLTPQPKVTIVVKDESNNPLPGAEVYCKCFTTQNHIRITDANGKVQEDDQNCACNGRVALVTKDGHCVDLAVSINTCPFDRTVECE
jgi:hypothetical protein